MRLGNGPIADKFFIAGALASLIGASWSGIYLWLALNGWVEIASTYASLRHAHVQIQTFLFLGLFVLGFLAHAGARLVAAQAAPSRWTLVWIPALFVTVGISCFSPSFLASGLVSAVYFSALIYIVRLQRTGDPALRATVGRFVALGLSAFSVAPFFNLGVSAYALLFFWGGLVTLIIGTGQQFIAVFLGGKRLSQQQARVVMALLVMTALCFVCAEITSQNLLWQIGGGAAFLTIAFYVSGTRLDRAWRNAGVDGLALAFLTGYAWSLMGALLLAIDGAQAADSAFHLWAIGWATPVIIAVSTQIVGFMSGQVSSRNRLFVAAMLFWQIVPIGRSLLPYLPLPAEFSILVGIAATTVLLFWCFLLMRAEILLLRLLPPKNHSSKLKILST